MQICMLFEPFGPATRRIPPFDQSMLQELAAIPKSTPDALLGWLFDCV